MLCLNFTWFSLLALGISLSFLIFSSFISLTLSPHVEEQSRNQEVGQWVRESLKTSERERKREVTADSNVFVLCVGDGEAAGCRNVHETLRQKRRSFLIFSGPTHDLHTASEPSYSTEAGLLFKPFVKEREQFMPEAVRLIDYQPSPPPQPLLVYLLVDLCHKMYLLYACILLFLFKQFTYAILLDF